MKTIWYLLLFLCFSMYTHGQSSASKVGSFTRLGQGARQLSLGNSGVALKANSASFYYNPSSVLFSDRKSIIGLNVQSLSLDRRIYSIGFHKPSKNRLQLSLGWIYATVSNLYEYSNEAIRGDKLKFGTNAFFGSFGVKLSDKLGVSFTGKYLVESLNDYFENDYRASGFSLDISLYYTYSKMTSLGVVIRDLSGKLTTNSDKVFGEVSRNSAFELNQKLPKYLVFGVSTQELFNSLGLPNMSSILDVKILEDKTRSIHTGIEYSGLENGDIRLGYDKNHFNVGLGIDLNILKYDMKLDYVYISSFYGEGGSHTFSWTMDINK